MNHSFGKTARTLALLVGVLILAVGVAAQTTETKEKVAVDKPPTITKMQLKGKVLLVGKGSMIVQMIPSDELRVFNVKPGKIFTVDGVERTLTELEMGTVLTADVTITETPLVERTKTELKGTVFWASPKSVILTLEKGENRKYEVKPDVKFIVNEKPIPVTDLRKGMKIKAVKIVEEPMAEIKEDAVVTGVGPK